MFETLPHPLPIGERKFGFFSFEFVSARPGADLRIAILSLL